MFVPIRSTHDRQPSGRQADALTAHLRADDALATDDLAGEGGLILVRVDRDGALVPVGIGLEKVLLLVAEEPLHSAPQSHLHIARAGDGSRRVHGRAEDIAAAQREARTIFQRQRLRGFASASSPSGRIVRLGRQGGPTHLTASEKASICDALASDSLPRFFRRSVSYGTGARYARPRWRSLNGWSARCTW